MRRTTWVRSLPVFALLALLPLAAACTGDTVEVLPGDAASRGIVAQGDGRVTVAPDIARLSLGVSVRRDNVAQARDDAASAMETLLASLRATGVADEDVQTIDFSIYPEYDYSREGQQQLIGFRVNNQISITVRDLARLADVIDRAVEAGGDVIVVQGASFSLDDPQVVRDQARALAVADARRRAEALAQEAGVSLGEVIRIEELGGSEPIPRAYLDQAQAAVPAGGPPSPIAGGQVVVTLSVIVTFSLE